MFFKFFTYILLDHYLNYHRSVQLFPVRRRITENTLQSKTAYINLAQHTCKFLKSFVYRPRTKPLDTEIQRKNDLFQSPK